LTGNNKFKAWEDEGNEGVVIISLFVYLNIAITDLQSDNESIKKTLI
jgi:hypothetical protein